MYLGSSKKGIKNRAAFHTAAFATGQQEDDNYRLPGWGKLVADKHDEVAAYREPHRSCGWEPAPKRFKPTPPAGQPPAHLPEAKIEVDATFDHSTSPERSANFTSSLNNKPSICSARRTIGQG